MRYSTKQIVGYLSVAFGIAWLVWFGIYLLTKDLNNQITEQLLMTMGGAIGMWCPGLAVFVLWLRNNRQKTMSPSFELNLSRAWKDYLIGWFAPPVLMLIGGGLFFAIFPHIFTLDFPLFKSLPTSASIPESQYSTIVLAQFIIGVFIAPFLNMMLGLGEEIGWRGFLFPALRERFPIWVSHLLIGVVWGLWHAPLTAMGHNYGTDYFGRPWLGFLTMIIFCFGVGILLSYITERSGSIWPAALCHGSVNAVVGFPLVFADTTVNNQLLGPHAAGLISCIPAVLLGLWLIPKFKAFHPVEQG